MEPFRRGRAATGNHFYGRNREIDYIIQSDDWMWVCGPRRIGKTSMLYKLKELAIKDGFKVFLFDLQKYEGDPFTGKDLLFRFLKSHDKDVFKPCNKNWRDFMNEEEPEAGFEEVVAFFLDYENVNGVLFLWDEAELLINTQQEDVNFLNRLTARLLPIDRFRFVVGANQKLAELSQGAINFRDSFRWIPLAGLIEEAPRQLLRREQTGGWVTPLKDSILDEAITWCGGNPFMLQALGSELARLSANNGSVIDTNKLEDCKSKLVEDPIIKAAFKDDFTKLTKEQQHVMSSICKSCIDINSRSDDAINFLKSYGYITTVEPIELTYLFYRNFIPQVDDEGEAKQEATNTNSVDGIRRTVFISYSHKDTNECKEVKEALIPLLRGRQIDLWDDKRIRPGSHWLKDIKETLKKAQTTILLISNAFLNSTFITDEEVPQILQKAQDQKCQVLCIHISYNNCQDVNWKMSDGTEASLADFQSLNSPEKPLNIFSDQERAKELRDLAKEIISALHGRSR